MGLFDGIGAGLVSGIANLFGGDAQNKANAQMAQKQMDFQERMSDTQYQRGVADLQAAGLNPMLAYSNGGASAPMGAMATMENVAGPAVDKGVHTALQAANTKADLEVKDHTATNLVSQTTKNEADAKVSDAVAANTSARTVSEIMRQPGIPQELKNLTLTGAMLDAQARNNSAAAGLHSVNALQGLQNIDINKPEQGKAGTWWGKNVSPYMKDISTGVTSATNAAKIAK